MDSRHILQKFITKIKAFNPNQATFPTTPPNETHQSHIQGDTDGNNNVVIDHNVMNLEMYPNLNGTPNNVTIMAHPLILNMQHCVTPSFSFRAQPIKKCLQPNQFPLLSAQKIILANGLMTYTVATYPNNRIMHTFTTHNSNRAIPPWQVATWNSW